MALVGNIRTSLKYFLRDNQWTQQRRTHPAQEALENQGSGGTATLE
jgi:hypothetical protein